MIDKNKFEFVEYNGIPYPAGISSSIREIAAHFDKVEIESAEKYSLHTEYSYGKRKLCSELISQFEELIAAHKNGVPQLWKSKKWSEEFADFLFLLTKHCNPPSVIEIHPPFNDYCDIDAFVGRYTLFERKIHEVYPMTSILIENRSGALYRGGAFIISKAKDIVKLCDMIEKNSIDLGVVLDFPQLLTAENMDTLNFDIDKYISLINGIAEHRKTIQGVHVWGKKKSQSGRWVAHAGNLDTYFGGNNKSKLAFIEGIASVCDDEMVRYLVPEINSGPDDLSRVVRDLFG